MPDSTSRHVLCNAYEFVLSHFGAEPDCDENRTLQESWSKAWSWEGRAEPWTEQVWVYDLRTNLHFTLKQKPIQCGDFDEVVMCYRAGKDPSSETHMERRDPERRWRSYDYADLLERDKLSLDLVWLRDTSLTDTDSLLAPAVLAAEFADDLEAALEQFTKIAARLARPGG